jgi:pimeloyl-ACP methyl ester carboxylesterase
MAYTDDDLLQLEAHGLPPLPADGQSGFVDHDGARIWYASFGAGPPVFLLHGSLGNSGNFAFQVPALVEAGYRAVTVDSRGHGRSTRDARPFSYEMLAADTRAVMAALGIAKAAFVGWSDGADAALVLAREAPERAAGIFFFACNVDPSGGLPFRLTPEIERIYQHHVRDYAALSPAPAGFDALRDDLGVMQAGQPDYGPRELGEITVPVWAAIGEHDEFIKRAHIEHIARSVPNGRFVLLRAVSHFAPLQRPELFDRTVLDFLAAIRW